MGVVHSSTDSNFLQEVEDLEKQKNEAKNDDQKKDIELKVTLKMLERDLADAKCVRDTLLLMNATVAVNKKFTFRFIVLSF